MTQRLDLRLAASSLGRYEAGPASATALTMSSIVVRESRDVPALLSVCREDEQVPRWVAHANAVGVHGYRASAALEPLSDAIEIVSLAENDRRVPERSGPGGGGPAPALSHVFAPM